MNTRYLQILSDVKVKLESLDPANLQEAQKKPSEQSPSRLSAAKRRLDHLYKKLTTGQGSHLKIQATGAKR